MPDTYDGLQRTVDRLSLGVITVRSDLRVAFCNRSAAELFAVQQEAALGASLTNVVSALGPVSESIIDHCQRVFEEGVTSRLLELPVPLELANAPAALESDASIGPQWSADADVTDATPLAATVFPETDAGSGDTDPTGIGSGQPASPQHGDVATDPAARARRRPPSDIRTDSRLRRVSTRLHGSPTEALSVDSEPSLIPKTSDAPMYIDIVMDPIMRRGTTPAPRGESAGPRRGRVAGAVLTILDATERARLRRSLESRSADLNMMFRVSTALRTTMRLDDSLFITLSALTAVDGGGFDRALLFLKADDRHSLQGSFGLGATSLAVASAIWEDLAHRADTLEDIVAKHDATLAGEIKTLTEALKDIEIPLDRPGGLLVRALLDRTTYTEAHARATPALEVHPRVRALAPLECFAAVPLALKDRAVGLLLLDSTSRPRSWSPPLVNLLEMYAHQTALAIDNAHVYARAVREAHTDAVTGLHNHGYFQQALLRAIAHAKRYRQQLSLVMVDIDHFKVFNDTWGHQAGDEVLGLLGRFFGESVRDSDLCARYGGEEFSLLMPLTKAEEALRIAERLRKRVAEELAFLAPDGSKQRLSASFGVATYPDHADDGKQLVARADAAMYRAKNAGRNRTVLYGKAIDE